MISEMRAWLEAGVNDHAIAGHLNTTACPGAWHSSVQARDE